MDLEDPDEFIRIARGDWLTTARGRVLHTVEDGDWTQDHRDDMTRDWLVTTPVRLACGQIAQMLAIPGPFSRGFAGGGLRRCTGCCRATGMPAGTGSPGNDPECREVLGLD